MNDRNYVSLVRHYQCRVVSCVVSHQVRLFKTLSMGKLVCRSQCAGDCCSMLPSGFENFCPTDNHGSINQKIESETAFFCCETDCKWNFGNRNNTTLVIVEDYETDWFQRVQ